MNIVLTGANGYIGKKVLSRLLEQAKNSSDMHIFAIDYKFSSQSSESSSFANEKHSDAVSYISADILSSEFNLATCINASPDLLIHLAWRNGFAHNNPSHIEDLSAQYCFVKQACEMGIKQVVLMGTMHEIGYWEGAITADTPCNPLSLYGIAKDALRRSFFFEADKNKVRALWLRGFYITGDDLYSQSVFGKILRADQEGKKDFPFTSGKNKYDFISVEQLAEDIVLCSMQKTVSGIINCCSGESVSLADYTEKFVAEHGLKIRLQYGAYPDRSYDSPAIWGDTTKLKQARAEAYKLGIGLKRGDI